VNPEHLFLGTNLDNRQDSYDKGRGNNGSKNGNAVLNEEKVSEIRKLWKTGNYTKAELSRKFKISPSVVGGLVKGKGWTHV
jgi:predicted transcriptional regulator